MTEKACTKCGEVKPLQEFPPDPRYKLGVRSACKACHSSRALDWNKRNPERARASAQRWHERNREQLRQRDRERYWSEPERHRTASLRYHQQFRGQQLARMRTYDAANADSHRARSARWRRENPDLWRLQRQKYRAQKRATRHDLTANEWQDILEHFGGWCAYCLQPMTEVTQDHMVPLSRGGEHTADNVVPCCRSCNSRKNTKTPLEFLASGGISPT